MNDWLKDTKLRQQLMLHEGVRQKPYTDTVGKVTIGVGRNLTDVGLSMDEVHALFENDIRVAVAELDTHLPWWRNMTENRQRVLIDMCFNLGIKKLLQFNRTLSAMEQGKYLVASHSMMRSLWAVQVKTRAVTLSKMMREG